MNWYWCLHCERVFLSEERPLSCHYKDCDGSFGDFWNWSCIKLDTDWPVIPQINTIYSLHG